MSKAPKKYEDDDGRQIADMSGVTRPNLWSFRFPSSAPWYQKGGKPAAKDPDLAEDAPPAREYPGSTLTPTERRSYMLAALGAGLGIAAIFGVAFAIVILLIGHAHC